MKPAMAYYYKHPDLSLPEDNSLIWRYMDLWKFEQMLDKNALFFSRADKQTDDLEGTYPEGMLDELEKVFKEIESGDKTKYTFLEWHERKEIPSRLISCWNTHPSEYQKMWAEYTRTGKSVALRSTIERLTTCFHDKRTEDCRVIWIGKVRYGKDALPTSIHKWNINYMLYPFFAKRSCFQWEEEVRAIVNIAQKNQVKIAHSDKGCYVSADLQRLVESVWLHPQSGDKFRHQVKAVLDSHGFGHVGIYKSKWDSLPYSA